MLAGFWLTLIVSCIYIYIYKYIYIYLFFTGLELTLQLDVPSLGHGVVTFQLYCTAVGAHVWKLDLLDPVRFQTHIIKLRAKQQRNRKSTEQCHEQ